MNEPVSMSAGLTDTPAGLAVVESGERISLDSRYPLRLDHYGAVIQVIAGHVDLFAIGAATEAAQGSRVHLFRVEAGGIIPAFPKLDDRQIGMHLAAIGGLNAEGLLLQRNRVDDPRLITAWIMQVSEAVLDTGVDWSIREAEGNTTTEFLPGERRRGGIRGLAWYRVEAGGVRLMNLEPAYHADSPPVPLTPSIWIEAESTGIARVCDDDSVQGEVLWRALDHFHLCAMAAIRSRVFAQSDQDEQRLLRRTELTTARAQELFDTLSAVVVRQRNSMLPEAAADDPLLAACRAAAAALKATVVRPPGRVPDRQDFASILEIARESQLRVRRTFLRGAWWKHDCGPLVGSHGADRDPVALIRSARRGYVMFKPKTGKRRFVNASLAAEFDPEAATFYPVLPSRPISFRDVLTFCLRHARGNLARLGFGALAIGLMALIVPLVTQVLVNSVIPRTELDQLAFCAAALVAAAIATAALQLMQGIAVLRLEGLLDWKLQAAIIDRLLRLPAGLFRQYTIGDLADRALGIDTIRRNLTGYALRGLMAVIFASFSLLLMFYYDLRLALIATGFALLRGAMILGASLVRLYNEYRHFGLQGRVEGFVLQLLAGVSKLRVANARVRALAVWGQQYAGQKRYFIASQRAANVLEVIESSFPTFATLTIFALVVQKSGLNPVLNLGVFLAFFAAFAQLMAAIGEGAKAASEMLIAVPRILRIRPLISTAVEISDDRRPAGEITGAIELSRVTFRYVAEGPPILDNFSLRVMPGEYVALVGPSGSGKSTIFRLLLGFERPEAGAIFFDGKALDTVDVSSLRRQMGVVLQNGRLSSGSIYDNVCGGVQLPTEQVWEAVRLAGLEADIKTMPMGLHTVIAEGVNTLSGGQRQRLMIARAVARRPRVLLLDEATSSLDNQSQATVAAALGRLNVTRLIIAHRLSTIRDADRIVVLANGKVIQSGGYQELSAIPGMFADLVRRQLL